MDENISGQIKKLLITNEDCFKDFCNSHISLDLITTDREDKYVLNKLVAWHNKYETKPDFKSIITDIKEEQATKQSNSSGSWAFVVGLCSITASGLPTA